MRSSSPDTTSWSGVLEKIVLHLFVAGRTARAERAIRTLRTICERDLAEFPYELHVIDVLTEPQRAEERKILATPTLIKERPYPPRRVIGDLGGDPRELLAALDLPPSS